MRKVKLFFSLSFILSCLAFASPAQANFLGLSPDASEAFLFFFLCLGAAIFAIHFIVEGVKRLKAKIKEWLSD